ncbi:outer membrane protein assembly factor BamE [Oryzibacter oryziterrae]|uniref:outer membrane protein assembly factor BamE n=1 Tax=Oryzibacter oryziterrae TaxID=2766474 RepID=UPI001F33161E|nr:outer membrane protein assembly factor BamE [Oryzibacter oryziterrae]
MSTKFIANALVVTLLAATGLTACGTPPIQHGYVMSEDALAQVPVGSSREQVALVLGSPSTTSTVGGESTYYYISQTIDENPLTGRSITDQKVMAVYFDDKGLVKQIANYGLKDGKVFDFIQRKTRTGGADLNLISQILAGVGNGNPLAPH